MNTDEATRIALGHEEIATTVDRYGHLLAQPTLAEALAAEIWDEVADASKAHIALVQQVGEIDKPPTPTEQDWIDVGITAGYQATLEVLMRRKMVKGT